MLKNKRYFLLVLGLLFSVVVGFYNMGEIMEAGEYSLLTMVLSVIVYIYWLGYSICRVSKSDKPKDTLIGISSGIITVAALTLIFPMITYSFIGFITYWSLGGIFATVNGLMPDIVIYMLVHLLLIVILLCVYMLKKKNTKA